MNKRTINMKTTLFLAAVCDQTYTQFHNRDGTFIMPEGYHLVGDMTGTSYKSARERFGFVIASDKAAVIAFRGTGTATEWISDLIARQTDYRYVKDGGMTHQGFTDIYRSLRGQLVELVSKVPSGLPLFVTGHSLGGALATLAAPDLDASFNERKIKVYTYASPRVGDPTFVRMFNRRIPVSVRVANKYDIVTQLPPLLYRSPKTEKTYIYLHVKGEYKLEQNAGSISANHSLTHYFDVLASQAPLAKQQICAAPAGWCPSSA
ncbi:Mbeg1-like protein [Paenibacillus sp. GCM10012307]|uniref:Lipase family protein n=1 Tax=Paenibacillus roseus TaxID=2798579 RepID=A0A934IY15_9BACL|nr:lipase family protein [Paenibacillus roseus]MBJ6361351.1 lipase family protein [Paenibacillus roseus]